MDQIILFFKESYVELKKVTWLTRKEVVGSTVVIIVLVLLLSAVISFLDFIFVKLVGIVI